MSGSVSGIPLEVPLKASEAAVVADAIFQHAGGRELTPELRADLDVHAAAMHLTSLRPCWGSLQVDPVHTGIYYLAVDAIASDGPLPLLLCIALAAAPSSRLFPNAQPIGRMRPGGGREVVVSAIPFSPADRAPIRTYVEQVDRAFLPRPHGPHPVIAVPASAHLPSAFDAFRHILKNTGVNLAAAIAQDGGAYEAILWSAIRAGWRDGYSAGLRVPADAGAHTIRAAAGFSRFIIDAASGRIEALHDLIRCVREDSGFGGGFDFEIVFDRRSPESVDAVLRSLQQSGRPAQLVTGGAEPAVAAVAAQYNAIANLVFSTVPESVPEGRWSYQLAHEAIATPESIVALATRAATVRERSPMPR